MKNKLSEKQLHHVIKKYCKGKATQAEIAFLNLYYGEFEKLPDVLDNYDEEKIQQLQDQIEDNISKNIYRQEPGSVVTMKRNKVWLRAAVVIGFLMAAGLGYYLYSENQQGNLTPETIAQSSQHLEHDALPGGNRAVLTLADGKKIILDSAQNGNVSRQGNMTIIKLGNGKLAYQPSVSTAVETNQLSAIQYNTISTPRGGQYQLVLSDGSKVWLNAATTLRYPVNFAAQERKVFLQGEAYFEIAKNKRKPFRVQVNDDVVEVLGTHFNVNAYPDEKILKTTLFEGSVKMVTPGESTLITPGEQARIARGSNTIAVKNNVDLPAVIAWKNGLFHFTNASVQQVMRQLGRWYDMDVTYEGRITERKFAGEMQRDLKLSQVLRILSQNDINYSIVGKNLIIKQ